MKKQTVLSDNTERAAEKMSWERLKKKVVSKSRRNKYIKNSIEHKDKVDKHIHHKAVDSKYASLSSSDERSQSKSIKSKVGASPIKVIDKQPFSLFKENGDKDSNYDSDDDWLNLTNKMPIMGI